MTTRTEALGKLASATRTAAAVLRSRGNLADLELAGFLQRALDRWEMHAAPAEPQPRGRGRPRREAGEQEGGE